MKDIIFIIISQKIDFLVDINNQTLNDISNYSLALFKQFVYETKTKNTLFSSNVVDNFLLFKHQSV